MRIMYCPDVICMLVGGGGVKVGKILVTGDGIPKTMPVCK